MKHTIDLVSYRQTNFKIKQSEPKELPHYVYLKITQTQKFLPLDSLSILSVHIQRINVWNNNLFKFIRGSSFLNHFIRLLHSKYVQVGISAQSAFPFIVKYKHKIAIKLNPIMSINYC